MPYSAHDVEFHLKARTIDEKTGIHREELMGSEELDVVERAFRTYRNSLITKYTERDSHLFLYERDKKKPVGVIL